MNHLKFYLDGPIPHFTDGLELKITNLEDCDYIIGTKIPWGITKFKIIQDNLNYYANINKKVIIFLISDTFDIFNIPYNVILFRINLLRSKKSLNEELLPFLWGKIETPFTFLKKTEKPIISFYGLLNNNYRLINFFRNNNNVITKFNIKNKFKNNELKNELEDNIINSHFTICNKNMCSYQFYKILSAGRIPILIDSDMLFPFEDKINWHSIAIIGANEKDVMDKLLYLWNNDDITQIQFKCKEIYINFFEKKNYFTRIFNHIKLPFIPTDFDINIYNKYTDLNKLNHSDLLKHYVHNGIKESRIYKLPSDFDIKVYREKNEDLKNLSDYNLIIHFVNFGHKENRQYRVDFI